MKTYKNSSLNLTNVTKKVIFHIKSWNRAQKYLIPMPFLTFGTNSTTAQVLSNVDKNRPFSKSVLDFQTEWLPCKKKCEIFMYYTHAWAWYLVVGLCYLAFWMKRQTMTPLPTTSGNWKQFFFCLEFVFWDEQHL